MKKCDKCGGALIVKEDSRSLRLIQSCCIMCGKRKTLNQISDYGPIRSQEKIGTKQITKKQELAFKKRQLKSFKNIFKVLSVLKEGKLYSNKDIATKCNIPLSQAYEWLQRSGTKPVSTIKRIKYYEFTNCFTWYRNKISEFEAIIDDFDVSDDFNVSDE